MLRNKLTSSFRHGSEYSSNPNNKHPAPNPSPVRGKAIAMEESIPINICFCKVASKIESGKKIVLSLAKRLQTFSSSSPLRLAIKRFIES